MPTAYDAVAPEYARHRRGQPFVAETLHQLHGQAGGRTVLEVGCGTGDYAAAMVRAGSCIVYALDPSREMLRHAPELEALNRVQGHAGNLPVADATLDMIYSVNMIHHLGSVAPYFREAFRALKPGGVLCTATDSEAIIRRRKPLSLYWPSTVPVELGRYHDMEALNGEMTAAGFRALDSREGRSTFSITDAGPYRDKAFSCLQLIPDDAFQSGLSAMEADLHTGPVEGNSELVFLWGKRP
jgi:ubiquinone/menaquinone biosynthesis C-methylase UbiE